jgi:hypothetical protein
MHIVMKSVCKYKIKRHEQKDTKRRKKVSAFTKKIEIIILTSFEI